MKSKITSKNNVIKFNDKNKKSCNGNTCDNCGNKEICEDVTFLRTMAGYVFDHYPSNVGKIITLIDLLNNIFLNLETIGEKDYADEMREKTIKMIKDKIFIFEKEKQ